MGSESVVALRMASALVHLIDRIRKEDTYNSVSSLGLIAIAVLTGECVEQEAICGPVLRYGVSIWAYGVVWTAILAF